MQFMQRELARVCDSQQRAEEPPTEEPAEADYFKTGAVVANRFKIVSSSFDYSQMTSISFVSGEETPRWRVRTSVLGAGPDDKEWMGRSQNRKPEMPDAVVVLGNDRTAFGAG